MPAGDDDRLYSDHVAASFQTRKHQERAIGRGIPAILFSCMRRSGSATVTHTLAKLCDAPTMRLSIGRFPDYFVAPSWLDMFLEGGAVTQDHFGPSDFNIGVLAQRGPLDIFVTIRDPRAAAYSSVLFAMPEPSTNIMRTNLEDMIERECLSAMIPWLQGWITWARKPENPLYVHWVPYAKTATNLSGTVRGICRILADRHPAMNRFTRRKDIDEVRLHFNIGNDDAWREKVGDATRQRLWEACTPEIRELLALKP
jgi:hypothetical protein